MPIKFRRTTERRMKMSPAMAEVMISEPSLSLSGIPAEVVTIKTP